MSTQIIEMSVGDCCRAFNHTFRVDGWARGVIRCPCGLVFAAEPSAKKDEAVITCERCGSWHTVIWR